MHFTPSVMHKYFSKWQSLLASFPGSTSQMISFGRWSLGTRLKSLVCVYNLVGLVTPKKFSAHFPGPPNKEIVPTPMYSTIGVFVTQCRYDFHRGVDIPIPLYSNVYAIADGTVRIAGSHPLYSDGVVQVNRSPYVLHFTIDS